MLLAGGDGTCGGRTTVAGGQGSERDAQPVKLIASASSSAVMGHLACMGIPFESCNARGSLALGLAGLFGGLQGCGLVLALRARVAGLVGLVAHAADLMQHRPGCKQHGQQCSAKRSQSKLQGARPEHRARPGRALRARASPAWRDH